MFGPTVSPQLVQIGKGRIASDPALLNLPRPLMVGAFLRPQRGPDPIIANSKSPCFFGQPPKCDVAHTSFRLAPLTSGMATSIRRQEGTPWHQNQNQLGLHMSSGWFLR